MCLSCMLTPPYINKPTTTSSDPPTKLVIQVLVFLQPAVTIWNHLILLICALMHSLAVHKLNHRPTKNILSCHWSLHSPDRAKHSAATASTRHEQTWDKRNDQITWIWNQEQHEWNTRLKCPVSLVLVALLLLLDVFIWLISNILDGNLQQESSQGWTRWCLAYTGAYGTENSQLPIGSWHLAAPVTSQIRPHPAYFRAEILWVCLNEPAKQWG